MVKQSKSSKWGPPLPSATRPTDGFAQPSGCGGAPHAARNPASPPRGEAYLKRLPAKVLKIDQSFVRDMLDDPDDLAILEGVLGLATAFSRESIALVMRHARGDTSDVHHHLEELLAMRDQLTQQLSRLIQADPG